MKKRMRLQMAILILALLLLLISITVGTFAWFTYRADVNVEPIAGTVGQTRGSLLIGSSPDGPFGEDCELNASAPAGGLSPLSTADLQHFYTAAMQNDQEEIVAFRNADDQVEGSTIHGRLYLKSTKEQADVYLSREALDFGTDIQTLAAMRLGLKITLPGRQTQTMIFRLDDMANVSGAEQKLTIPEAYDGMVVGGVPMQMVKDPSVSLSRYWAEKKTVVSEAEKDDPYTVEGKTKLFTLEAEQIADVEFWLWLEGCDVHCHNAGGTGVQNRNAALCLAFYGDISKGG